MERRREEECGPSRVKVKRLTANRASISEDETNNDRNRKKMTNSMVEGNSRCDMIAWSEQGHGDARRCVSTYIIVGCTSLFYFLWKMENNMMVNDASKDINCL